MYDNQPQNSVVSNIPPQSNTTSKTTPLIFICMILSIIGIVMGAIAFVQANKAIDSLTNDGNIATDENKVYNSSDDSEDPLSCTLPSSTDQIEYINLSRNHGDDEILIESGSIEYYNVTTDASGNQHYTSETIKTDTSEIMQYILENGRDNFSDTKDFGENVVTWSVDLISSDNSYCEAIGVDDVPDWFTSVFTSINNLNSSTEE